MDSTIASIIFETFDWLETENRQEWICIMVMPDHLHTIVKLGEGQTLANVLHSMKLFTAHEINRHLSRTGSLWQKGYADWGIRDETTLNNTISYCYANPVRAGIVASARDYPYWMQIQDGIVAVVWIETARLETAPTRRGDR